MSPVTISMAGKSHASGTAAKPVAMAINPDATNHRVRAGFTAGEKTTACARSMIRLHSASKMPIATEFMSRSRPSRAVPTSNTLTPPATAAERISNLRISEALT